MLLAGAGRWVERVGGPIQALLVFFMAGAVGNFVSVEIARATAAPLLPASAWVGGFALIGARSALVERGATISARSD